MQPVLYQTDYVYLYASMLFTVSPLLKNIYCESHAWEPWAVLGRPDRYGRYEFPNVLYVPQVDRDRLLSTIRHELDTNPTFVWTLQRQFENEARRLPRLIAAGDWGQVLDSAARVLSVGIFKEVFEAPQALEFLGQFMPVDDLSTTVLALYQPRCLPHFLKYELKLHYFAERLASGDRTAVQKFIRYAAHHSRFLLEDTPLHDPAEALAALRAAASTRQALRERHQQAVAAAQEAEHQVLSRADGFARMTLRSRLAMLQGLHFIRFIATWEELKHILVVETAHRLRPVLDALGLPIETTGPDELRSALQRGDCRGLLQG